MSTRKRINILPVLGISLFLIVVLVNFLLGKKSTQVQSPVKQEEIQKPVVLLNMSPDQALQKPEAATLRSAITITKPLPKKKILKDVDEEIIKKQQRKASPLSPQQSSVGASASATVDNEQPVSGVTATNKHISEEEAKDMNARGIIIW